MPPSVEAVGVGNLAAPRVPEEIFEALVVSVVAELDRPFDPDASVPIIAVVTVLQVGAALALVVVTT